MKQPIRQREQYAFIFPIQTRWADNDLYGHVNNVSYYSYFDSAANALLIQHCQFDPQHATSIGLVVESMCQFHQELSYPEIIEVGVAISKIGNSSVTYDLAIFKQQQADAAAQGHFVHVFVDRNTRQSTTLMQTTREALKPFLFKPLA